MSGAWRGGLFAFFPPFLHLQINSLLTEKKINNQYFYNENVSRKPFNWSMESKCNYLRKNCMKKKRKTPVEGGLWGQWDPKSELEKYLLDNPEVTKSTSIVLSGGSQKKNKMGRIKLHSVQYEIPLWIDGWMDLHFF